MNEYHPPQELLELAAQLADEGLDDDQTGALAADRRRRSGRRRLARRMVGAECHAPIGYRQPEPVPDGSGRIVAFKECSPADCLRLCGAGKVRIAAVNFQSLWSGSRGLPWRRLCC